MTGLDLNDPKATEILRYYFRDDAPAGYETWLERNLSQYDPIARSLRLRDSVSSKFQSSRSFKCWDDRCLHYIYGFLTQEERDQHTREHSITSKRDSGLSVSGTPPLIFPDQSSQFRNYGNEYSKHSSPLYLPRPIGSLQLTTPPVPGLTRDHRDSLKSYSFMSDPPAPLGDPRGSTDSEVDPLLPPLKRSRVGQSRLESIEELRLLRDVGPCLRCNVLRREVSKTLLDTVCYRMTLILQCDSNDPCSSCSNQADSASDDFWAALGCHRGPLSAFAETLVPSSSNVSPTHPDLWLMESSINLTPTGPDPTCITTCTAPKYERIPRPNLSSSPRILEDGEKSSRFRRRLLVD